MITNEQIAALIAAIFAYKYIGFAGGLGLFFALTRIIAKFLNGGMKKEDEEYPSMLRKEGE